MGSKAARAMNKELNLTENEWRAYMDEHGEKFRSQQLKKLHKAVSITVYV